MPDYEDIVERLEEQLEEAHTCQMQMLQQLDELSRKLGEAQGRLATSERVGMIEMWKEQFEDCMAARSELHTRCLRAEAELAAARDALEVYLDRVNEYEAIATKAEAELKAALEKLSEG